MHDSALSMLALLALLFSCNLHHAINFYCAIDTLMCATLISIAMLVVFLYATF